MLVYGDHCKIADPRERLEGVERELATVARMAPGIDRHSRLVGALIDVGQLVQGVADQGCSARELERLLCRLAASVVRSWDSQFAEIGEAVGVRRTALPGSVQLRLPEGFAFYAVYPEAYIEAARKLSLKGAPRVIGIRSIGTTLAAVVAATLNASPPVTVRPFGDPFARQAELPSETLRAGAHYVIVDEGPGLSGSSFGAVADWLEERGVTLDRIAFLCSHARGLGPRASPLHRRRWAKAQRVAAEFHPWWLERIFGPIEKMTIGERLKFLARTRGGRVLLKFAGLGNSGERKLELARALHAAGFAPEPLGLVHGFLAEGWCEDAHPLAPGEKPLDEIGRYIGARARLFPAPETSGATIDELLAMCRRNVSLALGDESARTFDRWNASSFAGRVRRVRTDNKLDRSKWLRLSDRRLLKSDALDHHRGHDLIGCQDMSWDVAGAAVEFGLDCSETDGLVAATGRAVDLELLQFHRLAYAAFRLGDAELAGTGSDRFRNALHLLTRQRESARILV